MTRPIQMTVGVTAGLAALAIMTTSALARDPDGRYINSPNHEWYQNAELTDAAKERFPFKKCCAHSDVVRTRFSVSKTTHGDEWFWLDGTRWKRIPDDVIHWGQAAPGGLPTLFVYAGQETCFFPGDGGI